MMTGIGSIIAPALGYDRTEAMVRATWLSVRKHVEEIDIFYSRENDKAPPMLTLSLVVFVIIDPLQTTNSVPGAGKELWAD